MSIEHQITEWVEKGSHYVAQYGLLAVGLGTFSETFLVVSVFIPGFGMIITAGMMSAQGQLNPWWTMLAAMAGGIAGDQTAYWIGYAMGDRLLRKHEKSLGRLRGALAHEGGFILLWFHFISPLRMVVPYIAGSLRFPRAKWLIFDTIGLALWIAFAFGMGYFFGGQLKKVGNLGYYVIFTAVLVMFIYTIWKVASLLRRRETAEDALGGEIEAAARVTAKAEALEERIEHTRAPRPPR